MSRPKLDFQTGSEIWQVTRRRIYLETMSQVLAPMTKVIVDDAAKGVVPYFQLPMQKALAAPPEPRAPQASGGDQSSAPVAEPGSGQ